MKIYALIVHVIEDSELLGVYLSSEEANAQKAVCESLGWDRSTSLVVYEMEAGRYYESGIARSA